MPYFKYKIAIAVAFVFIIFQGCGINNQTLSSDIPHRLQIVTTFPPLYSFAVNIVGDKADVYNLVPPGFSEHTWQAKASDIKKISNADLIVINGLRLEGFIENVMNSGGNSSVQVIDTSAEIKELLTDEEGINPHIWLSPRFAKMQITAILKALILADPQNAQYYEQNAKLYLQRIDGLLKEIQDKMSRTDKRPFIAFHSAFDYYLTDFNLLEYQKAVIQEFPGKEPSPAYLKDIINILSQKKARIVFTEPQFSPKIVETLQKEFNILTYELDPVGLELSAEGYENMMKKITDTFIQAFIDDVSLEKLHL